MCNDAKIIAEIYCSYLKELEEIKTDYQERLFHLDPLFMERIPDGLQSMYPVLYFRQLMIFKNMGYIFIAVTHVIIQSRTCLTINGIHSQI